MARRIRTGNMWYVQLVGDIAALCLAYGLTFFLRFHSAAGRRVFGRAFALLSIREPVELGPGLRLFYVDSAFRIVFILSVVLCTLYAFLDLYSGRRFIRRRPESWNIILANVVALGLFYSYFYVRRNVFHPRSVFALIAMLNILFTVCLRRMTKGLLQILRNAGVGRCRAILVGASEEAKALDEFISATRPHGIEIMNRIVPLEDETDDKLAARICQAAEEKTADMIICASAGMSIQRMAKILEDSGALGMPAKILGGELDVLMKQGRIATDMVHGVPLVHFNAPPRSGLARRVRDGLCAFVSGMALLVLSPLLVLIAVLIRLTSAGPALFVQERVGERQKPFRMYKFRTMHHLADEIQAQLEELNELGKGLFKMKKDPRATLIGRFLRRFSLDELPQLANVVKGEMTFVGPRPLPRRDFQNYYEKWHYMRHSGRPGLTGLWQVSGRSDVDFKSMCILDIYYLRNRNMILDVRIILKTIWVVLFAKGAY